MIKLAQLQIHNDMRVHPQKNAQRVFRAEDGYRIAWYPPHVFSLEIDYDHEGEKRTVQKWFASTNVENWVVAGEPADSAQAIREAMGDLERAQVSLLMRIEAHLARMAPAAAESGTRSAPASRQPRPA